MDKEKRYADVYDLRLDIDAYIHIIRSKYRELDPDDVIYNPKLTKSRDYFDGMIDAFYLARARVIANAPTADVREVVLCKDCKYITEHYDTDGNAPYWTCSEWDSGTDYDGFCHYAERKGE